MIKIRINNKQVSSDVLSAIRRLWIQQLILKTVDHSHYCN